MPKSWNGSIYTAKESRKEDGEEYPDGNYEYEPSGTYGQSDYTVRKRNDDTYDVYVKSDSDKGHSHDHIDKYGNLLDNYHDMRTSLLSFLTDLDLAKISYKDNQECIKSVQKILKR